MNWNLSGRLIDCCSCNLACPCAFGLAEPDRGWCSGSLTSDIQEGNSGGLSLTGTRVIWAVDLPGDFASGNGTARLYIDDSATAEQQGELEAIFMGKRGGPWELVADAIVSKWLPTRAIPIAIHFDKEIEINARDVGRVRLAPLVSAAGEPVKIINPGGFAPFGIGEIHCAYSSGTGWWDSGMRRWEATSHGWGSVSRFSWSA
jgi:hypothetical protein